MNGLLEMWDKRTKEKTKELNKRKTIKLYPLFISFFSNNCFIIHRAYTILLKN